MAAKKKAVAPVAPVAPVVEAEVVLSFAERKAHLKAAQAAVYQADFGFSGVQSPENTISLHATRALLLTALANIDAIL